MRGRGAGGKNCSRNGSNTQFTAPASKPRAPNHHCPQEMADLPASAPRMCEYTRGSAAVIPQSARLRSAPRMCERSLIQYLHLYHFNSISMLLNVPCGSHIAMFGVLALTWHPITDYILQ